VSRWLTLLICLLLAAPAVAAIDFENDDGDDYLTASGQFFTGGGSTPPFSFIFWFVLEDGATDLARWASWGSNLNRFLGHAYATNAGFQARNTTAYEALSGNAALDDVAYAYAATAASATDRRVVLAGDWANSGTSTSSSNPNSASLARIGWAQDGLNTHDGLWWGSSVYADAVSRSQIEGLAAGLHPFSIRSETLTHYWSMRGNTGDAVGTVYDRVGSLDMTAVGAPVYAETPPKIKHHYHHMGG